MTKPKTSFSQKLILTTVSLCIVLIALEIILRLAGTILITIQNNQNKISFQSKSSYTILCLGESTTYLGGEYSYPSQLEDILNTSLNTKSFKVINKGVPGIGTNYIVKNAEKWILEYKPDIIITMMGINDDNKLIPLDQQTRIRHPLGPLVQLRIFKLFQWLKTSFKSQKNKIPINNSTPQKKNRATPVTFDVLFSEHLKKTPLAFQKLYTLAVMLKAQGKNEAAEEIFKKLVTADFSVVINKKIYMELGDILIKTKKFSEMIKPLKYLLSSPQDSKAAEWINVLCTKQKGVEELISLLKEFANKNPDTASFYDLLGSCYTDIGDESQASLYFSKASSMRVGGLNEKTRLNYLQLADIFTKYHIKGIFMQYPLRDIRIIINMLKDHEQSSAWFYVDNETIFRKELELLPYDQLFTDHFAGNFGHCTKKGNRLIAENVTNTIRKIIEED